MTRELSPRLKTAVVTGGALFLGGLATVVLPNAPFPTRWPPAELLVALVRIELFVTTFNLVVLLALSGAYVNLYRDLPNKYTRSLVVLSVALLLYAFTSNPLIPLVFGFPPIPDLGPFVFLPDVFVGLASVVLFYQSQT